MYHFFKSIYLHATSLPEYSVLLLGLDGAGKTTLNNQMRALFSLDSASSSSQQDPGKTVPTVGQNVSVVALPDLYLRVWDVGGQHALRGLWQSYYTSCHAIVFVIDSTDIGDADISRLPASTAANSSAADENKDTAQAPSMHSSTASRGAASTTPRQIYTRSFSTVALQSEDDSRLNECRLVLESVLQHADAIGVPLLVLANKQDREDCVEVVRIKEEFVRKVFEGEKGTNVRDSRVLPCSALTGTGVKEAVEWLCSRVKWNHEARPPVMR